MPHKTSETLNHEIEIETEDKDKKIHDVIFALNFLHKEAKKAGDEDISRLIESTFSICMHTYSIIKRNEFSALALGVTTTKKTQ